MPLCQRSTAPSSPMPTPDQQERTLEPTLAPEPTTSPTPSGLPPEAEFPVPHWERYEFLERLGSGGMGEVFKAREHGGNVAATVRALGMHRTQLRRVLERHAIAAPPDSE